MFKLVVVLIMFTLIGLNVSDNTKKKRKYAVGHARLGNKDKKFDDIKEAIDFFNYKVENDGSAPADNENIRRAVKFEGSYQVGDYVIFDRKFKKKM